MVEWPECMAGGESGAMTDILHSFWFWYMVAWVVIWLVSELVPDKA